MRKNRALVALVFLVMLSIPPISAAEPDIAATGIVLSQKILQAGGFSVKLRQKATRNQSLGKNILPNGSFESGDDATGVPTGWTSNFYIFSRVNDAQKKQKLLPLLSPLASRSLSRLNPAVGKQCFLLTTPLVVHERMKASGGDYLNFTNTVSRYVTLPKATGETKFILTFRYRGQVVSAAQNSRVRALVRFFDRSQKPWNGKTTRNFTQQMFSPTPEWREGTLAFMVPKETKALRILLFLDGCGKVAYDEVQLRSVETASGVTMALLPAAYMDQQFFLSRGDPLAMHFGLKNEKSVPIKNLQAVIELPTNIHVLGMHENGSLLRMEAFTRDKKTYYRYHIDIRKFKRYIKREKYNMWSGVLTVYVRTYAMAGTPMAPLRYWVEDGAYHSPKTTLPLHVIASIRGKQPQHFKSGAVFSGADIFIGSPEAVEAVADFYQRTGFNSAHLGASPLNTAFGKRGIVRYTQPFWVCNGYRLGEGQKPKGVAFQYADGSPYKNALCPVAVYTRSPYYQEEIEKKIFRKLLVLDRSAEHIMSNWEPYMFSFKGCFCPRCKAEFQRYTKFSPAEVDRLWPQKVLIDQRETWIKFRSWQHAKMMRTLEASVNRLGKEVGREAHFIPEINLSFALPNDRRGDEHALRDFSQILPWVELWGPYPCHDFNKDYDYIPGVHLITQAAATAATNALDSEARRVPGGKRPKLIAFPQGQQLESWVTEPEAIGMDTLTFFLNGWEGAFIYYFPRGYDARYWRVVADNNSTFAAFEKFTLTGTRQTKHTITAITPLPKVDERMFRFAMYVDQDRWRKASLLQSWEYALGKKRLIAVGNYWQKGECFFRLSVQTAAGKYVLREPLRGRYYANTDGKATFTAEELAHGVLLQVGAMRMRFFVIEPWQTGMNIGTPILSQDLRRTLSARRFAIQQAMTAEKNRAKKVAAQTDKKRPDYSNLKTLTAGAFSCTVSNAADNSPRLTIGTPSQRIRIDMTKGGRIDSWRVKGAELVHQDKTFGLAVDAIWWPKKSACIFTQPFRVIKQIVRNDRVKIILARKLGAEAGALAGVVLQKTFSVQDDKADFQVTTVIKNRTDHDVSFSHRYHNLVAALESHKGQTGWVTRWDQGKEISFKRMFTQQAFAMRTRQDKRLLEAFKMDQSAFLSEARIRFSCDWLPVAIEALPAKERLAAVVFWDDGNFKCATFEPISECVNLASGQEWDTSIVWRAVRK